MTGNVPGLLCLFSAPLLAPDNEPLALLDIEAEEKEIRKCAGNTAISRLRIGFATVAELIRGITDGFNIIHLSGHGNEDFLLFEDEKGGSQLLKKEYIKKIFEKSKGIDLVVVSACHSENVARCLIAAGVKYAVAVRKDSPVYDFAAIAFIAKFYATLFKGYSVKEAFDIAKLAVEGNPQWDKIKEEIKQQYLAEGKPFLPEERKFILLPDDRVMDMDVAVVSREKSETGMEVQGIGQHITNIPARQSQLFTGRSKEILDVVNSVLLNRAVTVKGAGGIGKTTLAVEVGRWFHLRNHFKDGIHKIDIREMETGDSVMRKIALTIGFEFEKEEEFFNAVKHLDCLFIIDNAEDVLWKDSKNFRRLVHCILECAANIKILVTSQKEIGGYLYEKEEVYTLPGLDWKSSVELFIKRIKTGKSSIDDDDLSRLLNMLGGLPLSIIIMASQMSEGVSAGDLIKRIEQSNAGAVKGITDMNPSHGESLVKSLDSAYEHLPGKAKVLFQLLSYFPTGIYKDFLAQVMAENIEDYLVQLREVSLVEIDGNNRYSLLPSVRLYSLSRLSDEVCDDYRSKILAFTAGYSYFIKENYFKEKALHFKLLFIMEEPNFRYVVETMKGIVNGTGDCSNKEVITDNLLRLYNYSDWIDDGVKFGEKVLNQYKEIGAKLGEANTLFVLGNLRVRRARLEEAETHYGQCLDMYKEIGSKVGEANTLFVLGNLCVRRARLEESETHYRQCLDMHKEIGSKVGEANTRKALGDLGVRRDRLEEAETHYRQCLDMYKEIGDKLGEANTMLSQARLSVLKDNIPGSEPLLEKAHALYIEVGDEDGRGYICEIQMLACMVQNDISNSGCRWEQCLEIKRKTENYSETLGWLLFYAKHLEKKTLTTEARLCLDYAQKIADLSESNDLRDLIPSLM
ncbi:MAG: tetratricopeptide repeat protein [Candidatus Aminicenantes bacterium]|nr:tetratricopeptide repeat protein [Candidatus Aminicenantes bacterium]